MTLSDLELHIQIETSSKAETPVPLIEVVPEFAEVLTEETRDAALVRFVADLALRVAGKPVKKPCILDAGELLLDREQFDGLPWKAQMEALIDGSRQCEVVLRRRGRGARLRF